MLVAALACVAMLGVVGGGAGGGTGGVEQAGQAGSGVDEAPEAIVVLKDGRRINGFLKERTGERVVLRIGGVDMMLPASQVDHVFIEAPVLERYRQMRIAVEDGDVDRLLLLAEWLRAREHYDEALEEIAHVLSLEPGNAQAQRLRTLVEMQRRLRQRAEERRGRSPEERPTRRTEPGPAPTPFPLLNADQINLIKVYEVDLREPPKLRIERQTVERLLSEYQSDPVIPTTREGREAFMRLPPHKVLEVIFRVQARHLYPEVAVLSAPESLRAFRDEVHGVWLMNSCATTRCHGGEQAGRLRLHNLRPRTEATYLTNFLILDRFRLPDGTALINYNNPAESPLLQMGLGRQDSVYPHPRAPGTDGRGDQWRPFFRSTGDRRFKQAVDWINAMYRPRPEYPVHYEPPAAAVSQLPPGREAGPR